jgi:hypothetical protein
VGGDKGEESREEQKRNTINGQIETIIKRKIKITKSIRFRFRYPISAGCRYKYSSG